jgi:hypothetical protein
LRLVFVMDSRNQVLHFEPTLRLLAERGDAVHVAFERQQPTEGEVSTELLARYERFTMGSAGADRSADPPLAHKVRASIDYLFYLGPWFARSPGLRARMRRSAPRVLRRLEALLLGIGPVRTMLRWGFRLLERALPAPPQVEQLLREQQPDLLLVSPLLLQRSVQPDYLRAAKARGIPTGMLVASWDNLSNKEPFHEKPGFVAVWNEDQRREAIEMHGLRDDTVFVTGAQSLDPWFESTPETEREEFCAVAGLDRRRPFVLYAGSSLRITGREEPDFVEQWANWLLGLEEPWAEGLQILVRPYPTTVRDWTARDFRHLGARFSVWPRTPMELGDRAARTALFDSIYHCSAVVGINTSAMIESAIIGRPVLTLVTPQFREGQEGTLHFGQISRGGGIVRVARSFEEHARQLADSLGGESPEQAAERERFLESFVRPRGLARPVAPFVLEVIDRACGQGDRPQAQRHVQGVSRTRPAPDRA